MLAAHGQLAERARLVRLQELDQAVAQRLARFAAQQLGDGWRREMRTRNGVGLAVGRAAAQLLGPWSLYEARWDGKTVAELFVASAAHRVERERAWIAAQGRAWWSVWEVRKLILGGSVDVRDTFTGEERRVLESGASSLFGRDNVLARVVDFDGVTVFAGSHERSLPPRPADALIEEIRRTRGLGSERLSIGELRERVSPGDWLLAWERMVVRHDEEEMQARENSEGHAFEVTGDHYTFEPSDRATIEATLAGLAEPQQRVDAPDERDFVFVVQGNPSWDQDIGWATVGPSTLVVESDSVQRADRLRAQLETALGALVRHQLRDEEPHDEEPPLTGDSATERERDQAVLEADRSEFARWIDTPHPALRHATPRQAAPQRELRRELVLLLKEMENFESQFVPEEQFDVAPLWAELGLRDDEAPSA